MKTTTTMNMEDLLTKAFEDDQRRQWVAFNEEMVRANLPTVTWEEYRRLGRTPLSEQDADELAALVRNPVHQNKKG